MVAQHIPGITHERVLCVRYEAAAMLQLPRKLLPPPLLHVLMKGIFINPFLVAAPAPVRPPDSPDRIQNRTTGIGRNPPFENPPLIRSFNTVVQRVTPKRWQMME